MPRVLNRRTEGWPPGAVYVGRPSKWGNPFSHQPNTLARFRVPTRQAAVSAYERWVIDQPDLMRALDELRGRDLVCWCVPEPCHADVLLRLANR